ncbi:uncharacterized protein [Arachis hypogaea]|uniref:2'-phosphotransferase n=1 Tax=Arachis hypogaea TaxID=3818 RepID=A0A445E6J5_ARAHY|nr:uncharacterized protein LOC112752900 [Arachis hypogaea]XP_025657363.1 uncharacterized protein LOC112752900 [Arachis hypogaea]XP_025657364.1 uncharacterized protein LOC112752900 [Arachis hypogaea]RYR71082.1 hypothetical protein Ahy_A02g005379 isoform A [Arachis hypogaea]RYR71083.1 hypothetical protein Ahy_A02g005379 isoform B [Arachis hypogaea]
MANNIGSNSVAYTLIEGQSINRPPFFNGKYYNYWKERMKIFVQSIDYNLWKIIMNGPQIPTKIGVDGVVTPKTEAEWSEDDKKKVELNAKAVNLLNCAISFEEYRKISISKTAKEIWDKLQVTHEGTPRVKEMRIDMLNKEYEMFFMKKGESKESKKDLSKVICHNCREAGHYKYECLKLKKQDKSRKDKKKGLKAIASFDMRNDRERTRGCDSGGSFGKDKIDALGRLLTRILRHMASELNLDMRSDGYVKVNDLLKLNMKTFANIPLRSHNIDDVREAVQNDNKQRFSLIEENGELLIRANQGHTITV